MDLFRRLFSQSSSDTIETNKVADHEPESARAEKIIEPLVPDDHEQAVTTNQMGICDF
jgi:hypothetical protein